MNLVIFNPKLHFINTDSWSGVKGSNFLGREFSGSLKY